MDIKIKKCDCCGIEARSDMSEDKELFDGFSILEIFFNTYWDALSGTIPRNIKYNKTNKTLSICESCIYDLGLAEPKVNVSVKDNTSGFLKCLSNILKGK
jgi:hypothetical protein